MGVNERITVQEAAQLLGVSRQYLRENLKKKKGAFKSIGYAIKKHNRCTYFIYKQRVLELIEKRGDLSCQ